MMSTGPPGHLMWSNIYGSSKPEMRRGVEWRRLWALFRPYLHQEVLMLVSVIVINVLGLLPPICTKWLIDDAFAHHSLPTAYFDVGVMIAAALAAGFAGVYQGYLNSFIGESILRDLRISLVAHMQRMSLAFFTTTKTGEIMNRVSSDVDSIDNVLTGTISGILNNLFMILTTLVAIFSCDWQLSLVSLAVVPLMILPLSPVGRRMYEIRGKTRIKRDEIEAITQETLSLSGVTLIKSFVREDFERRRFAGVAQELMRLEVRLAMVGRWFMASIGSMVVVGPAIVWIAGAWLFMQHRVSLGTVVEFIAFLGRLYTPAAALVGVQVQIISALAVFERIFEYLDREPEAVKEHGGVVPAEVRGAVSFEHVEFAYGTRVVLHDLSFMVQPGQMAAFVGHSGGGKTTLTALVPRFYDAVAGVVRVDGYDVRDLSLAALRANIGIVTQETYLFHDSIESNLRYGRTDATEEQIIAAARAANIHESIMELPNGYATVVGERGHKLSGGERQRLAIARVLLKDPRILILDEATSALDSHNEALIQAALVPLMRGRTSLVVAHRLSTILAADVIYVVDRGRIVEAGTHAALLERNGAYAQLYRDQFERDVPMDEMSFGDGS